MAISVWARGIRRLARIVEMLWHRQRIIGFEFDWLINLRNRKTEESALIK